MPRKESAIQTLVPEVDQIYTDLVNRMSDPDHLEKWMESRGVHCEIFIYTGDSPWTEVLDAGAELHASAVESGRRLFRTEGDSDSLVFFIAKSADQVLTLLKKFRDTEMVVIDVMTA